MTVYADPTQTTSGNIDTVAVDGTPYSTENAVIVQVTVTDPAVLIAAYSKADSGSPSEALSRQIARVVLDALVAYTS